MDGTFNNRRPEGQRRRNAVTYATVDHHHLRGDPPWKREEEEEEAYCAVLIFTIETNQTLSSIPGRR